MKRLYVFLLLFLFGAEVFAQNLTALERKIVMASPEEMLNMVMDRNYQQELLRIFTGLEEMDVDEVFPVYMAEFPGITKDECLYIILKVALIAALGSGDENGLETGFDILGFCEEIDSISNSSELPEELQDLVESSYWQDCIAFYRMFDSEVFLKERFPEYF